MFPRQGHPFRDSPLPARPGGGPGEAGHSRHGPCCLAGNSLLATLTPRPRLTGLPRVASQLLGSGGGEGGALPPCGLPPRSEDGRQLSPGLLRCMCPVVLAPEDTGGIAERSGLAPWPRVEKDSRAAPSSAEGSAATRWPRLPRALGDAQLHCCWPGPAVTPVGPSGPLEQCYLPWWECLTVLCCQLLGLSDA